MNIKFVALIVALFFVAANGAAGGPSDNQGPFSVNTTGAACKRTVTHSMLTTRNIWYKSVAACRYGRKAGTGVESAIVADINVIDRPDMSIGVFHATAVNMTDVSAGLAAFRIILERVIEYSDVDGVPGYQPQVGGDWPCQNGITLLKNVGWSAFNLDSTAVDNAGNTIYTATSTSSTPSYYTISVQFSTSSMTNGKIRLDPSSFKFNFDIAGYVYNNASCASGLAVKILVISGGTPHPKPTTTTVNTDVDLSNQDAFTVPDANGNAQGTYFTWDKFVTSGNGSMLGLHHNVSRLAQDVNEVLSSLNIPVHWSATAVWYSVPTQVTDFSWDPYVLADDSVGASSSSSAATTSTIAGLFVVIMSVIAALL